MLAQHLFGTVALDALGAAVPCADAALGIEHVDSVVLNTLNQDLELPFAFLCGLARRDTRTDIAHATDEVDAAIFVDWRDRELHWKLLSRPAQSGYLDPASEHRPVAVLKETLEPTLVHRAMLRWDDELRHHSSDRLLARPTEHFRRAVVPISDRAV